METVSSADIKDNRQQADVDQIKVQVAKLMKQLNDLKVSKKSKRSSTNPEEQDSDNDNELNLQSLLGSKDAAEDNESEMQVDDDGTLFTGTDIFTELLDGETFSDFKDYLIDETLLVEAYP